MIGLTAEAMLLQPGIQLIKRTGTRDRCEELRLGELDQSLYVALIIPLAGPAELVFKQIMALQRHERAGLQPFTVTKDFGHRNPSIVIKDRQRHAAKKGDGAHMPIQKRLRRLGRVGFDKTAI